MHLFFGFLAQTSNSSRIDLSIKLFIQSADENGESPKK